MLFGRGRGGPHTVGTLVVDRKSAAEILCDVANDLGPRNALVVGDASKLSRRELETTLSVVKLALEVRKRPTMVLKAVMEQWDMVRIVRELY